MEKTLFLTASVGSELSSFFHFMGVWGGGVAEVFLSFTDVKGGVHEAYSNPFVKWFDD